jgi:hypothetical protein
MTIEYQNIFTRVQVRGPHYPGVPIGADNENRIGHADGQLLGGQVRRRADRALLSRALG